MRGRGNVPQHNQVANYPLGYNQYPQPQPAAWNRSQRRGGLRGQNQEYSFYPTQRPNSYGHNYRNSASGDACPGPSSGTRGTVNAAFRSLPHHFSYDQNQFNDQQKKQTNNENRKKTNKKMTGKMNQRESDTASQRSDTTSMASRSQKESESVLTSCNRMYLCPKCGESYTFRHTQNKYAGKIPLILQCDHTMCQECIYQNLKNNKINCAICKNDSVLTQEQTPVCLSDVQDVFSPNFYIIGVLSYYRPQYGYFGNLENIKFVSTGMKKYLNLPNPSDRCCFTTCSNEATMFCPSCEGIYCEDCCTIVHKSTSKLMSHQPVPRNKNKFSLMLEMCVAHPTMPVEFLCKTCDINACCYCILDNHSPEHERVALYHLNETEMEEFKQLKLNAAKALKEILSTQKKTASLANFNADSVKKKICHYFADYHAKIISMERKLCNEVECFKTSNRGLDVIQANLTASAEQLKQLVAFDENKIGDKKFNLRDALHKLRQIDNIPRFLLNEAGSGEPITFAPNSEAIDSLNNEFVLEKCQDSEYRLVAKKDLPENYVFDLDDSESDLEEIASVTASESNRSSGQSSAKSKVVKTTHSVKQASNRPLHRLAKKCVDMERVDVQHINSVDSFFIQYKSMQSKLSQLNKDIENYVKMGGAQAVKEPQLNDLYLSLYVTESHHSSKNEQKWFRARLVDVKHHENETLYEMFFIDYGKTQTVDINRIKDIPSFLVQKKPFAIECMLHNPMNVNWSKQAHYSLAKILNGKQVSMVEKSVNSGIHEVDLLIAASDGGLTSVTDILIHATNSVNSVNDESASIRSLEGSVRKNVFIDQPNVFPNSQHFSKGDKEKIIIANVVDPSNIFVHLVTHQDAFRAMTQSIKKHFKSEKTNGCIPLEGTYVLVEHRDVIRSSWHRGFVKAVDLNNDRIQVLLVDWGISVVVSASKVKPIPEKFTKLESQAVLLKLAHIAPYNQKCVWSQHASNFLQAFHNSQTVLKMVVHETKPEVEVALFDSTSTNVDLCLNAMMVEQNLADSTGPVSKQLEWPQYTIQDTSFSEEEGFMSTLLKKVDEEVPQDSEEEDLTDFKKRQVEVVKVEAPDRIWVKFWEFRDEHATLYKEIQIHYSQEQRTKAKWEAADYCVVELENEYARGKILTEVNGKYTVHLYDKIEEITLPIDKIFVYEQYFMKFRRTVIKSHLANIRPAGDTGKWSSSSIEALQEIFSKHRRIFANKSPETNSDLSSLPLDMWYGRIMQGGPLDPDRMKYVSINSFLVKLGYAYRIPRPVTPKLPFKKSTNGDELLQSISGGVNDTDLEENPSKVEGTEAEATSTKDEKIEQVKAVIQEKKKRPDLIMKILSKKKDRETKSLENKQIKILSKTDQEQGEGLGEDVLFKEDGHTDNSSKSLVNWCDIVEAELKEQNEISNHDDAEAEEESSPYHKKEVVIDDWLPPFRLTKKEFMAKVTCVETGGYLYLHEEEMDSVYIKMEANIKEYFDSTPPDICDHKWESGHLCTIKYSDGKWYRGRILKVKNPKTISVFMIDFGSDHDLSPDVLFREVLYTDIGAFATRVKLDKVYSKSSSWLSSDYDNMHDLVSDWCRIIVKGPLEVDLPLVDVYNENADFVNQKLVELCPNLSRCYNFPIGTEEEEEDDTVVIESIESDEICANEVIKVVMDRFDEELLQINSVSLSTYKQSALPSNLLQGEKVFLEIGGILNYNKVAIKIPDSDVSEGMYDLVMSIQDSIEDVRTLTNLKVGKPCLAPFSEDGVWYRGKIRHTKSMDLGFVEIYFVDYGNSESVPIDQIKEIPSQYLELPQQSWEANINVMIEDDSDLVSVMQVINTLDRKTRHVKLVKDDPFTIDIYDKEDTLCYQTLLDSGSLKPIY